MDKLNSYHKEFQAYMTYALQRFLIDKKGFSEYDAKIKVMRDFEEVEAEAKEQGYL